MSAQSLLSQLLAHAWITSPWTVLSGIPQAHALGDTRTQPRNIVTRAQMLALQEREALSHSGRVLELGESPHVAIFCEEA